MIRKKKCMEEENKMAQFKEKSSEKQTRKEITLKYLVTFVIAMLLFSVLSRATASVTTPMVTVETPKKGSLTYKIEGIGMIEASSEVYLKVEADMKIDKVFVKAGDCVEENQELFSYQMDELQKKIEIAQADLENSQRNYEKQRLTNSLKKEETDTKTQEMALERAKEDYEAAARKLSEVKEDYQEKVKKIEENLGKEKQEEYATADKAYEDAKDAYKETNDTCEKVYNNAVKAVKLAQKAKEKVVKEAYEALNEAKESTKELTQKRDTLIDLINLYGYYASCNDLVKCNEILTEILIEYFGKDTFESIKKSIAAAEIEYTQATEDLQNIQKKWDLVLQNTLEKLSKLEADQEEYQTLYEQYQQDLLSKETEILSASRQVNRTYNTLQNSNTKYTEITKAATAYRNYKLFIEFGTDTTTYQAFYEALIDDSIFDEKTYHEAQAQVTKKESAITELITEQDELISQAQENVAEAKEDWDKKLQKSQKLVTESKEKLLELMEKVYSNEDDMKTAWNEVETQEDVVKTAKRALDDTMIILEDAKESLKLSQTNEVIQDKIDALDLITFNDDIETKKKKIQELEELKATGGIVTAPMDGLITTLEVNPQAKVTGNEKVTITPSSSVFTGNLDKDDRKYMEEGAVISCQLDTMEKAMDAEVLSIGYDQVNNKYNFTAKLPDGDYLPKTSGSYTYAQQSTKYDITVPISALRSENNNYYVLILSETETILGTETIAYRVNVEVTSKDSQTAAVTNLYSDMQVITGSSRNISEGDKVRIGSYE